MIDERIRKEDKKREIFAFTFSKEEAFAAVSAFSPSRCALWLIMAPFGPRYKDMWSIPRRGKRRAGKTRRIETNPAKFGIMWSEVHLITTVD